MSVVEDTVLEADVVEETTKIRQRADLVAPSGFDPSCVFLLHTNFENLYDPTSDTFMFVCRGCGDPVKRTEREKHHRAHRRALDRKEKSVPKNAGPKEQQTRAHRERQARERSQQTVPTPEVLEDEPKDRPGRRTRTAAIKPVAATGTRADSERVLEGLYERLRAVLPAVERHDNANAGYTAFKLSGRLIGYGWLTSKADLRVEAAIPLGTITDDRIVACNRSVTMASRTRIDETTYDLAVAMLTAAAREGATT